jgi:hypothetical protein
MPVEEEISVVSNYTWPYPHKCKAGTHTSPRRRPIPALWKDGHSSASPECNDMADIWGWTRAHIALILCTDPWYIPPSGHYVQFSIFGLHREGEQSFACWLTLYTTASYTDNSWRARTMRTSWDALGGRLIKRHDVGNVSGTIWYCSNSGRTQLRKREMSRWWGRKQPVRWSTHHIQPTGPPTEHDAPRLPRSKQLKNTKNRIVNEWPYNSQTTRTVCTKHLKGTIKIYKKIRGARFSAPVQTGPGAHSASCTMGTELRVVR